MSDRQKTLKAVIEALVDYVTYTQRGTTLENGEVRISTLEHLMAAFYGLGVDNALVTVDNFEVPILDGSALPYVRAILPDGLDEQDAERQYFVVREPIHYKDEKSGSETSGGRVFRGSDYRLQFSRSGRSEVPL